MEDRICKVYLNFVYKTLLPATFLKNLKNMKSTEKTFDDAKFRRQQGDKLSEKLNPAMPAVGKPDEQVVDYH